MLELDRAFRTETVVLLEGMAGVGKTEAAVGFARWRAETGGLDGPIFFFRFEHYLPLAQVCDRVGVTFHKVIKQQLEVEWHLLDAEQRRRVALDVLKRERCFLIWDNFEPVAGFPTGSKSDWTADEQKELRDLLAGLRGGKTKVLLTSRRDEPWLGPIYRRVPLCGLKKEEAHELAVKVLQRVGLNPATIRALPPYQSLLEYLNGNPLAIQVILPELRQKKPDGLLQALQTGTAKFDQDDPSQGRERSLSASLTYRLDALGPQIRQKLGVLALFQGFVDADVLAMISSVDLIPKPIRGLKRKDWIRLLNPATEIGLLRRVDKGFYSVHPVLPWFLHDLLAETFGDQIALLEKAFADAYAAYGESLFKLFQTKTKIAMDLLVAEEDNLLHALGLARSHNYWQAISGILYGLTKLLTTQGRWVECERIITSINAEVSTATDEPIAGREHLWLVVHGLLTEMANRQGRLGQQKEITLRLKDYFEHVGDDRNFAAALQQLGTISHRQRQFDEAEQFCRRSLEIAERIGDKYGQAVVLHQLGITTQKRQRFDEAEELYRRSLLIREHIGDEHGQASSLHQLGMAAQERGWFDKAEELYRRSLEIEKRIGDKHARAMTLHQLGTIASERQRFDEAERLHRRSLEIREYIRDERGQASSLHQLGTIAYFLERFDEAQGWYRRSLDIEERIGNEYGQASSLHQLGMVTEEQGHTAEAEHFYRRAEAIYLRVNDEYHRNVVRESLARVRQSSAPGNPPPPPTS
jgi:tetratricopeptide (TPR) repeat protein